MKSIASLFCVMLVVNTISTNALSKESDAPYLNWSVEQVNQISRSIRAGKSLKPPTWKDGNKVAVLLSFDVDNELVVMTKLKSADEIPAVAMSNAEYGANIGLHRIVNILKQKNIPATFFIPAMMLEIHPETINEIRRLKDYEVGVHGWIHEYNPMVGSYGAEKKLIEDSVEVLTEKFGVKPQGYRAPKWAFSRHTLDVIKDLDFSYDSSMMARDEPYEICTQVSSEKITGTGIIELPVSWILDDYPLLSQASSIYSSPREVLQVYKDEFDLAYEEGGLFSLAFHPHVIGRRSRILILEKLIDYIKTKEGVWFATHAQVYDFINEESVVESSCDVYTTTEN